MRDNEMYNPVKQARFDVEMAHEEYKEGMVLYQHVLRCEWRLARYIEAFGEEGRLIPVPSTEPRYEY